MHVAEIRVSKAHTLVRDGVLASLSHYQAPSFAFDKQSISIKSNSIDYLK